MRKLFGTILIGLHLNCLASISVDAQVQQYINKTWSKLTRDSTQDTEATSRQLLYIPRDEKLSAIQEKISSNINVRYLPKHVSDIKEHGLLYLPYPYVVPGGRFNEMYGWDSFFIELGLLESGKTQLAKHMVDNTIYEIQHYGTILNANRTYFLERSQPPLLTQMILAYYQKDVDNVWLQSTISAIDKLYAFWTKPPHLIPELGLSRYYANGLGPTPEEDQNYYKKAQEFYRNNDVSDYDKKNFYNEIEDNLTGLFYIADRTVRESGLDMTAKYGPFGVGIINYAPVDLNVFLYQMEKDASFIHHILNNSQEEQLWVFRAEKRKELINKYLWNESLGYYFDYNFKRQRQRPYIYATTFYPLWAGMASTEQAERVASNLPSLLAAGGLVTSPYRAKLQWDAPFGWAPLQYFAVMGLSKYGYRQQAQEIARRFIKTVNQGFIKHKAIFEKYDVQSINTSSKEKISFGYNTNEIGFGWTNGVYLVLNNFKNN